MELQGNPSRHQSEDVCCSSCSSHNKHAQTTSVVREKLVLGCTCIIYVPNGLHLSCVRTYVQTFVSGIHVYRFTSFCLVFTRPFFCLHLTSYVVTVQNFGGCLVHRCFMHNSTTLIYPCTSALCKNQLQMSQSLDNCYKVSYSKHSAILQSFPNCGQTLPRTLTGFVHNCSMTCVLSNNCPQFGRFCNNGYITVTLCQMVCFVLLRVV